MLPTTKCFARSVSKFYRTTAPSVQRCPPTPPRNPPTKSPRDEAPEDFVGENFSCTNRGTDRGFQEIEMRVKCEYNGDFAASGGYFLRHASACSSAISFPLVVMVVMLTDNRSQTVATGPIRGPVATVTNRSGWENQTVGAKPNTPCRLQTVILPANPNGSVRAKRGPSF
jgi:hypothetical protein